MAWSVASFHNTQMLVKQKSNTKYLKYVYGCNSKCM